MTDIPPGTPDFMLKWFRENPGRYTVNGGPRLPAAPPTSARGEPAVDPVEFASEAEFQTAVIALAHAHGWLVAHFRPAWVKGKDGTASRMVTPVAADGKGFLDLELVRDRLIKIELKYATKLRPDQKKWVDAYCRAGVPVYVFYPSDWPEIVSVISSPPVR